MEEVIERTRPPIDLKVGPMQLEVPHPIPLSLECTFCPLFTLGVVFKVNVVVWPSGWYMWLNPSKVSTLTFKLQQARIVCAYLHPPKTSLVYKFPCLLNLPHIIWSGLYFSSISHCPFYMEISEVVNKHLSVKPLTYQLWEICKIFKTSETEKKMVKFYASVTAFFKLYLWWYI